MRVIVYYPFFIDRNRASASHLRPQRMVEGFRELGYYVEVVSGYARERKAKCRELKARILSGERFDFIYSEASTMPTLLTERHHCPLHPFFDFRFLHFCKKHQIRIGLFYRDAYWAHPEYRLRGIKGWISRWFYRYDLIMYDRLIDRLYLPSMRMLAHVPHTFRIPVEALPSGVGKHSVRMPEETKREGPIQLLYVGGVGLVYDMRMLYRALMRIPNVQLTICCRADEWERIKHLYLPLMTERVRVVHAVEKQLDELYSEADFACLLFYGSEYNKCAVSYKLFEALGFARPVLVYEGGAMADIVQKKGSGYVIPRDENAIVSFLQRLKPISKEEILKLTEIASTNRWSDRCETVAKGLTRDA